MIRLTILILLLTLMATGCNNASITEPGVATTESKVAIADPEVAGAKPRVADSAETKYVTFQLMTGLPGYAGPPPMPGHFALGKAQVEGFVHEVVQAIGTKGDARHKLGFTVETLCFNMSDAETRQFIHDAFAVAQENDVAVTFHIDDSLLSTTACA